MNITDHQIMRSFLLGMTSMLLLISCSTDSKKTEGEKPELLEVPTSLVAFSIDFPRSELEKGVNQILPSKIWNGALALKNEKDTLLLKVDRKGHIDLSIVNGDVYVSVPLKIEVAIRKKIFGLTVSNEDTPIVFEGQLKVATDLTLGDDWDIDVNCLYKGFDLKGKPTLDILGLSFQIEQTIKDALDEHRDEISDLLGRALDQAFDFRTLIGNVFEDLQQGKRVARNPRKFWLYTHPEALSGQLIPKNRDTLSLHLEFRTSIQISAENRSVNRPVKLQKRGTPLDSKSTIVAYPEVKIGLDIIADLVGENILEKEFTYEDYKIRFTEVAASRYENQLQLVLTSAGDINGHFYVRGRPLLEADGTLTIEDFSYRIDAKEEWVGIAEWAIHDVIESYILDEMTLDTSTMIGKLDSIIVSGISRSPISSKMDVKLDFKNVSSYALQITDEDLQWIFYLEGSGALQLKSGIFEKSN